MINYEVKPVVCDYGVFEDGELKLICNSAKNALLIKDILEKDARHHLGFDGCLVYTSSDFCAFEEKHKERTRVL